MSGATEVVIPGGDERSAELVREVHRRYLPNVVLAHGERYDSPLWEARAEGVAYVCRNYACQAPTDDVDTLIRALEPS